MQFIVTKPLLVTAESPTEALAKVPTPEGCIEVSINVQAKPHGPASFDAITDKR